MTDVWLDTLYPGDEDEVEETDDGEESDDEGGLCIKPF